MAVARTVEQRNTETEIRDAAAARGATVHLVDGFGHFHIRGALLVNYYPFGKKRTAYVAGTTHGKHYVSPAEAVAMAFAPPPMAEAAKKDRRSGHSKSVRKRLLKTKGRACHWCGRQLTLATSTVEHVVPLARGGLDNDNNRVLACEPCNRERGHAMPELEVPRESLACKPLNGCEK